MRFYLSFILLCSLFISRALAQDINVNIENDAVYHFLSEVYYEPEDTSVVLKYMVPKRLDIPNPAVIPVPQVEADTITVQYVATPSQPTTIGVPKGATEALVYNLLPKQTYHYQVIADGKTVAEGNIITEGQLRMVYTPHVRNIRDLGGWPCAGNKAIKYGKLFRGAELNGSHTSDSTDLDILTNQIGIGSELDMRASYNEGHNISVFGFLNSSQTGSGEVPTYYYTNDSGQLPENLTSYNFQYRWRREFEFIVNNLKQERPVYIHCVSGANRTGYLCVLLEGLLGVGYSDMIKDYELTTFGIKTEKKEKIDPLFEFITDLEGETLQAKFNYYFLKYLNIKQADIDYFLSEMLKDNTATGIKTMNSGDIHVNHAVYDLQGRKATPHTSHPSPHTPHLYIERCVDGTTRKYIR
jgi:hypothetical protein